MVKDKVLRSGYTLIELLVVTSIIIIVMGILLSYFNEFSNDKKLEQEAKKIGDVLDLAKKKANASDVSKCSAGSSLDSYGVRITSGTQYQLYPYCTGGTPSPILYPTLQAGITFPTPTLEIAFTNIVSGGSVPATANCIKVQSTSTRCKYVKVDASGNISLSVIMACPTPCP